MNEELPPSLAVKPNIPLRMQTIEQLRAERDYWLRKVNDAECWGAAYSAAMSFHRACVNEIKWRKEQP
jgi:hypothetical protein